MVEVHKTSSHQSSFIRLTDYVDSEKLIHLSAEELQALVCGSDGRYLEHISKISGASIEFVSKPTPGFQVLATDQKSFRTGCAEGLRVVHAIRTASIKAASNAQQQTIVDGLLPTPPVHPMQTGKFSASPVYHPLYSNVSIMPTYVPMMLVIPDAILLTPDVAPPVPPMSPEVCMQIIKSPYLSVARRRKNLDMENLKEHAKSRIAPQSPESALLPPSNDFMPDQLLLPAAITSFEDEIADCLPGVPGARQSKEYKKIRRKITEIDDLMASNTELDYCQRIKVERRSMYLDQIRSILKGDPIIIEPKDSPPTVDEDTSETVSTTPPEPVSPIPEIKPLPLIRKKQKKIVLPRKVVAKLEIPKTPNPEISLWQKIYEFLCLLISFFARIFIHFKH